MRMRILLVLSLVLAASSAWAQAPSPKFLDAYNKGVDAFRLGKFDEARTHLEAAKAIDPTLPGPWRFLAAVAKEEGKFDECIASAREAIRVKPDSNEIQRTIELHDECRTQAGRALFSGTYDPGQGALSVTTDQAGASVEVNGIKYGSTPLAPRTLPVGEVEVAVEKSGYLKATRKVVILASIVTDVDVVLEKDPNAKGVDPGTAPADLTIGWIRVETTAPGAVILVDGKPRAIDAQGRFVVEQGNHEVTIRAEGHESQTRTVRVSKGTMTTLRVTLRSQAKVDRSRSLGTIFLGTGVGLAAIGALTAVLSIRDADEARDIWAVETSRPTSGDTSAVPVRTRQEMEDKVASSERYALISAISYGVAAVAVGVGGYFLVKGRPFKEKNRRLTIVPVLDDDGGYGAAALGEVRW